MWICDKCDQVKIEYGNDNMGNQELAGENKYGFILHFQTNINHSIPISPPFSQIHICRIYNALIFPIIPVVENPATIGLIATLPPAAITSFAPTICSSV